MTLLSRVVLLLVVLLLPSACGEQREPRETDAEAVVREYVEALDREDVDGILDLVTDPKDAGDEALAKVETYGGRDAVNSSTRIDISDLGDDVLHVTIDWAGTQKPEADRITLVLDDRGEWVVALEEPTR